MSQKWIVNSDHTKELFMQHVEKLYNEKKYIEFSFKTGQQRTNKQNAALHKYLEMLSTALNDAGLDMKKVLKPSVDIPWNTVNAKEYLWKPIQKALLNKNSTTKADRNEYTQVYETLNRHTAEKFGVSIPFPTREK